MADLIDRQAAIELMLAALDDDWEPDYAKDRMCELPSAQQGRKKGKWYYKIIRRNYNDDEYYTCSECGKEIVNPEYKNYCPNCGERLEPPEEET